MERKKIIDVFKGIAAICVVIGHCIQCGSGEYFLNNSLYYNNLFFRFIYSFHMPLFALISGYLFVYTVQKRTFVQIIKNRFVTLIVPIVVWTIINYCIDLSEYKMEYNIILLIKRFILMLLNTLWFLWAILLCSLIVSIIYYKIKGISNIKILIVYFLPVLLFFITTDMFTIKEIKFLYPYFAIGFLYNLYKDKISHKIYDIVNKNYFIISIAVMWGGILTKFNKQCFIYTTGITFLGKESWLNQFQYDIIRWLCGFLGSIFVMLLVKKLYNKWQCKLWGLIELVGRKSLGIYIFDVYISQYILTYISSNIQFDLRICIIETIIILPICLGLTMLIEKSKLLKKLLLGGR